MDITIEHENDDADIIGPSVKKAIAKLTDILNSIDPEFQDRATIEFVSYDESSYVCYYVRYARPETEQEITAKEYYKHQVEQLRINREREQYEALKAKFGD